MVKLQDIDGPDAVDVYIRLDVFVYPLGLVPGTQVTFYNVERKMSKTQSVYCTFNDESALVLHRWDKQKLCDTSNRSAALELFDTTYEYNVIYWSVSDVISGLSSVQLLLSNFKIQTAFAVCLCACVLA